MKRNKKNKQSPYCTSGSNESSNGSKSLVPKRQLQKQEYQLPVSSNSNGSRAGSDISNPSNNATGVVNLHPSRRFTNSEEKHLEITHRERVEKNAVVDENINKTEYRATNVQIIEDYGPAKDGLIVDQKKAVAKPPPQKLQDSLVTASSPSRGSVLTNPQQPGGRFGSSLNNSNTQDIYPLKPGKAIQMFKNVLSDYERGEILNYREIY